MALTTTTTQTDRILAEIIATRVLSGSYPTLVLTPHANLDFDLVGAPASAKAYPRLADDGAAASVNEGSDASTVTTASMGTQLLNTPGEVYMRFDVTDKVMKKRVPGFDPTALRSVLDSGDVGALLGLFSEEVMRARKAVFEKLEVDLMALTDDFGTTVGTSGSNVTLANIESSIYQLTKKETGNADRWAFFLDPIQISDLRSEIALTSGGLGGGVWTGDVQSITSVKPTLLTTGLQGALFGIPVYVTANSVNPHPNSAADEAGCLMVRGEGHPETGLPGAFVVTVSDDFHPRFDPDVSGRLCEVYGFMEYAVGERADDMGISIITDA